MPAPRTWSFTLDFLPPSVNKMYAYDFKRKRKFLTDEAVSYREQIRHAAQAAGFRPDLRCRYAVIAVFTMPEWGSSDIDSPLKSLLDSALSSRSDQRIVHLLTDKRVRPGRPARTDVKIYQVGAGGVLAWLRCLIAEADAPDDDDGEKRSAG